MILKGKVIDGLGNASFWVKKVEEIFLKETGLKLFPGTLNIKLENDYEFEKNWIINPEEYGGTQKVYVQECKVFGNQAYILRAEKTEHGLDIIEIVSDINFRKEYKIQTGDEIEVII